MQTLRYLIQVLDGRSYDLWLFSFAKKTLSAPFNDTKMTAEVKLASALDMHKGRQLCCVKGDNLVID